MGSCKRNINCLRAAMWASAWPLLLSWTAVGGISVNPIPKSRLVDLSYTDSDPSGPSRSPTPMLMLS